MRTAPDSPSPHPRTRLSRRGPKRRLQPQSCPIAPQGSALLGISAAHVRLLLVSPLLRDTSAGGSEQSLIDRLNQSGEEGGNPPSLGASAQAQTHVVVFKRQHCLEERTLPPSAECACSAARKRSVLSLLRLRDRDSSLLSPHPPEPGGEGRELGKGGKDGWRGRGERAVTHSMAAERRGGGGLS